MLNFNYFMPTELIHGEKVVEKNAGKLAKLGRKALLVTGRRSAKLSGALDDTLAALNEAGIQYASFDTVENNPSLENVTEGGKVAREYEPEFILAIGGGSPLDAGKAIAVLATNDIPARNLYEGNYENDPLPVVAIPTTTGTGSEATPYAVLTIKEKETKWGFGHPSLFPRIAFLDYRYTLSLPAGITLDTAVDALSHLVEGYLTRRAKDSSDIFAEKGIKLWQECIPALRARSFSPEVRDKLLVASTLGGMTISHTGTAFVHALGYSLTFYHDIPHGRANGFVMAEFLRVTSRAAADRVKNVLTWLGMEEPAQLAGLMKEFFGDDFRLTPGEVAKYAERASTTRNVANSLGEVTEEDLAEVLRRSLG